ncbi:hypothetical protein VC34_07795 [Pseudomonas fluorescens]|uniref:Uncharacterized protein n=1 Tax=Pseudomonas fluorescens TaxID=294 RepID=A0A0F4TQ98_PSEFL|nr:hypothetical protein VC34_07795 [Pseudomonas fluorescens]
MAKGVIAWLVWKSNPLLFVKYVFGSFLIVTVFAAYTQILCFKHEVRMRVFWNNMVRIPCSSVLYYNILTAVRASVILLL